MREDKVVCRAQLARLLQLILAIRPGRHPNARELAEACEVSPRTVYRDLGTLALAGVPVLYRPDRRGYELREGFFLEPTRLDEPEALALVLAALHPGRRSGLEPAAEARTALRKIVQGLVPEIRDRAMALIDFLDATGPASAQPAGRSQVVADLLFSLARQVQIRLWYHVPGTPGPLVTKIDPYGLTLQGDAWCLVGRSSLACGDDAIRIPWIVRVAPTDEPASSASGPIARRRVQSDRNPSQPVTIASVGG